MPSLAKSVPSQYGHTTVGLVVRLGAWYEWRCVGGVVSGEVFFFAERVLRGSVLPYFSIAVFV
ncbi:MAG: hypothetical protein GY906_29950 [bacterium]|nr:hypothetical protein [bacterium]